MGHMTHTSATHDVHRTVCPSDAYPVPRTLDTGLRALMLCAAAQSSNPHRVQPQPTLLGARESDETTLPLLNRAIL